MAKEAAREREMHRYYQPWFDTFLATDFEPAPTSPPSTEPGATHRPRSSKDKALTAFAQLGCLRLNAKRSVVTLLGTTKQFIIAEATKTLSLMSDEQHASGDGLWFGSAYIDREGGISGDALYPAKHTAYDPDGSTFTAPALVISNIAVHETYKTRGYAGHGVSFYCGVPITTLHGQVIGVYTVTDDSPRGGLTATELRFLVDMSAIVMQHLQAIRNDCARKRGERLVLGLGGFMEGDMILDAADADRAPDHPEPKDEPAQNRLGAPRGPIHATISKNPEFLGLTAQDSNAPPKDSTSMLPSGNDHPGMPRPQISSETTPKNPSVPVSQTTLPLSKVVKAKGGAAVDSRQVFDRAAAILKYCLNSDGVLFFNASSANLSSGSRMESSGPIGKMHHSKSKRNKHRAPLDPAAGVLEASLADESSLSSDESATGRTQSDSSSSHRNREQKCQVLGLSMADPAKIVTLPEKALRRLVRHHPKGKCFTFDQYGNPASSDEASEASEFVSGTDGSKHDSETRYNPEKRVPTTRSLLKALPGARCVVFLPLWDTGKQRWHSGLVIWSNDHGALTNVDDNMVYLKSFSNAIMNEVHRLDLSLADTAKSTFLANISHELRSPLHGILGSIEFLHDTAMDDFQSSMVISVETCGKTLLDTVNHVLDYAKIHNLSRTHRLAKGASVEEEPASKPEASLTEDFDMAIVVEEAVEAVYAGQVFRTANADALEGKSPIQTAASRAIQQRLDRKSMLGKSAALYSSPVRLTLNIDSQAQWLVRSQPGAVRRIVMNVLGNALKYTSKGSINVSLEVDRSRNKASSNLHMVLQVADTGKGMSDDFMKNHAFTAFSQENTLATGIGLGLSIVRQIVDSLGGKIDLLSEKNVGTDIRIWLSLPKSQNGAGESIGEKNIIPEMRERTAGREMCMLIPEAEDLVGNTVGSLVPMPTIESSMRNLVMQWFRMKVTATTTMSGRTPDFFIYPEPPPIDYLIDFHGNPDTDKEIPVIILCANAFQAASLRASGVHYLTDIGRVIEVIAQPCGPQKLAKVLHRCMQRLALLDKGRSTKDGPPTVSFSFSKPERETGEIVPEAAPQVNGLGPASAGPSQGSSSSQIREPAPMAVRPESSRKLSHEDNMTARRAFARRSLSEGTATTGPTEEMRPSDDLSPTPVADMPRVLVVDDNHINLNLLITFVRKSGHPYESASDGLKAVQAYQKSFLAEPKGRHAFKYILMDISMPVMNGMAATKEIRKFERENDVQKPVTIIALTGMGSDVAQNEAQGAGFDQFLSKPVKFRDLVKLLV